MFDEPGIGTTWDNSRNLILGAVKPAALDASFCAVGVIVPPGYSRSTSIIITLSFALHLLELLVLLIQL